MDIWQIIMQSPLAAWIGYVHLSRPSKSECSVRHQLVEGEQSSTGKKIDELHKDVREIRDILVKHVSEK